ncbi:MAG: DUF1883 domain-containing protein [Bacteroidales bacterium]|nr:DUF1883 domain-containing protein [Bacteroidales bacterium]
MQFTHYDLGNKSRGEIVEITLSGSAANVRLLDSSNFQSYRNGRAHRYIGGLAKQSPVRLQIPNSGHWHVTVDMQGLRGTVRSSIRMLPGALPELRQPSLSTIPSLVHKREEAPYNDSEKIEREYDVFISHATEDKDEVVRPLAIALNREGLSVWYDEFELKIGDSLRQKIDKGLANSKFGIVVLSKDFIRKGWTNYELDGIITKSTTREQVVLPIWHNITKKEVMDYSPSLADKLARNTSSYTVEEIAKEIAEVIKISNN